MSAKRLWAIRAFMLTPENISSWSHIPATGPCDLLTPGDSDRTRIANRMRSWKKNGYRRWVITRGRSWLWWDLHDGAGFIIFYGTEEELDLGN